MDNKKDMLNASGCLDMTAYKAIKKTNKDNAIATEEERFHKLLHMIFENCDLLGFRIDGRITLIDKETGRIWK